MSEKNIYQRLNAVMQEVRYVQKDKAVSAGQGGNYKAVTHDQLVSVARDSMVKNGIVIEPRQTEGELFPQSMKADGSPSTMRLYRGMYSVRFINIDSPSEFSEVSIEAHANDNGDKAPGKALTYAVKSAVLKVLWLETGENDESRVEERVTRQKSQAKDQATKIAGSMREAANVTGLDALLEMGLGLEGITKPLADRLKAVHAERKAQLEKQS